MVDASVNTTPSPGCSSNVMKRTDIQMQGPRSCFESEGLTSDSEWGEGGGLGLKTLFLSISL